MGLFSRMKGALSSKANAAIDKMSDPAKQLDLVIFDLEEQRKAAYKELLSYKATAKTMEQDMARYQERADHLEKRAMQAVKAGEDELAKECLRDRKHALAEIVKITRDRDEAASYALQLNRSRKDLETKLQILKLKKGTMATQIAAARSGSGNLLGIDDDLFDRLDKAEERIDSEVIASEVDAILDSDEVAEANEMDAKLLAAETAHGGGDALDQLKARMQADKDKKQLKK
jgi:phage shock protein A